MKSHNLKRARALLAAPAPTPKYYLTGTGARPDWQGNYYVWRVSAAGKWKLAGEGPTPYVALAKAGRDTTNAPRPSWAVIRNMEV
jgi:hypothetical protein